MSYRSSADPHHAAVVMPDGHRGDSCGPARDTGHLRAVTRGMAACHASRYDMDVVRPRSRSLFASSLGVRWSRPTVRRRNPCVTSLARRSEFLPERPCPSPSFEKEA